MSVQHSHLGLACWRHGVVSLYGHLVTAVHREPDKHLTNTLRPDCVTYERIGWPAVNDVNWGKHGKMQHKLKSFIHYCIIYSLFASIGHSCSMKPTCSYRIDAYLLKLILLSSLTMSQTSDEPPTLSVPMMAMAMVPPITIAICTASVQITAFKPPCQRTHAWKSAKM